MTLKVEYAPEAEETLISVYEFILDKFGKRSAESFLTKTEKIIGLVAELPHMYKASPFDENVRIGLITKQTSVFSE
jgi:plasmid stabilization system protein ParE